MNKVPADSVDQERTGELRPEYDFDYSQSKPNRFAAAMGRDSVAVVLDPDVASVFQDPAKVNAALRSVIAAMHDRADTVK